MPKAAIKARSAVASESLTQSDDDAQSADGPLDAPSTPESAQIIRAAAASCTDEQVERAQKHVNGYARADWRRAFETLALTLALYLGLMAMHPWFCAWGALGRTAWVLLRGGVFVRVFILGHDCMHNAFFPKWAWNVAVGRVAAAEALTP